MEHALCDETIKSETIPDIGCERQSRVNKQTSVQRGEDTPPLFQCPEVAAARAIVTAVAKAFPAILRLFWIYFVNFKLFNVLFILF
jgi:hypothetical protein